MPGELVRFIFQRLLDRDQLRFLDMMERVIAESEKPLYDVSEACDLAVDLDLDSGWSEVSSRILPKASRKHVLALCQVVNRDQAQASLIAWRDGVESAQVWIEKRIDSFSGDPYRTRLDPDGSLITWSFAEDGEDGNALPDEDHRYFTDYVWQIYPASKND